MGTNRQCPNVLFVHYNDLKADLSGEMPRIAALAGVFQGGSQRFLVKLYRVPFVNISSSPWAEDQAELVRMAEVLGVRGEALRGS